MFTIPEKRILSSPYFSILRETDRFIEVESKNTKHRWTIMKVPVDDGRLPIILYHDHNTRTSHYHKHAVARSVKHAVTMIQGHDAYVLSGSSAK